MGTTVLKRLLKSLCNHSTWYYAVFWKIKLQNQAILTWEDGYCDYSKSKKLMGSMTKDSHENDEDKNIYSYYGTNIFDSDSGSWSVESAVADMPYLQYVLGEGAVGRVADSGNHSWVFLENIFTSDEFSTLLYEGPNEWLIQYASGIKTILLVPVPPFGVLQLGSLQLVAEDMSMVTYIKDRFSTLHFIGGNTASFASDKGVWTCSGSVFESSLFENLDEQSTVTNNMLEVENYGAVDDVKPPGSTSSQFVTVQDVLSTSRKLRPETRHSGKGEMGNENLLEMFSLEMETQSPFCTQLGVGSHDTELFEAEYFDFQSCSADNVLKPEIGHNFVTKKEYDTADDTFSFPADYELRKGLGLTFQGRKQTSESLYRSSGSIKDTTTSLMCDRDFNEGDIEHLLEAMIANIYDNSDDALCNNSVSLRTNSTSGKFAPPARKYFQSESSTIMGDDPVPWILPEPAVSEIGWKTLTCFSTSNSLFVNEQKGCDITQPRMGVKKSSSNRRTKFTANPRQRPRDRQLIQDRIKELREIVPNGAKCSIDGLLEKTIKHMLYLRRVTDQAEKLKQLLQPEDSNSKNCTALETATHQQNGASWAFDIGSELQICPIVVEDLESPGHMLIIKMLCNDMGVFLEIAQVIRRLELTILKGVIEHHSNNSWAHFIVETPRGFHRMDVFWPLMHLLQRRRNPISCRI